MRTVSLLVLALLLTACPCRTCREPLPIRYDFGVAPGSEGASELSRKQAWLLSGGPAPAEFVAAICASTFDDVVAGRHCGSRVQVCCAGACTPEEVKAACVDRCRAALDRHCCANALPGFIDALPACQGMRLEACTLKPTGEGPKPLQ